MCIRLRMASMLLLNRPKTQPDLPRPHLPLQYIFEIFVGKIEIVMVEKLYDFTHCDNFPAQRQQFVL